MKTDWRLICSAVVCAAITACGSAGSAETATPTAATTTTPSASLPRAAPTPRPPPTPAPTTAPTRWYPADYAVVDLEAVGLDFPVIAYKWLPPFDVKSSRGGTCWALYVIPRDGCARLYVTVSITDRTDTVVDSSLDGVGAVASGQRARLDFVSFADGAYRARVSDVECFQRPLPHPPTRPPS